MKKTELEIKKSTIVWIILIIGFLVWHFWPTTLYTEFSFEVNETGEPLDGEMFFDNFSRGYTEEGKIKIYSEGLDYEEIMFKGVYNNTSFSVYYDFPLDYWDYSEVPFSVTQEYLLNIIEEDNLLEEDRFSNISEPHWGRLLLTYRFETECRERQINLFRLAFKKIALETYSGLDFKETNSSPDFSIYCKPKKLDDLTLADASHDTSEYNENLIIHADINIYGQGMTCSTDYPALEVHEILHSFGFIHNPIVGSIMHPFSAESSRRCKITEIDKEYVECISYIYTNGKISKCDIKNTIISSSTTYGCSEGFYEVTGTEYCCPEPNMTIEDGYCI